MAGGQQPVVHIDSLFGQRMIGLAFLRVLPDMDKSLSIEEVQQLGFLPLDRFPVPNQRKSGSVYWTKIILENRLGVGRELWLTVQADISYGYQVRASGKVEQSQTGLMMPYRSKTIQSQKHRWANFLPVHLDSGETATLYIRNQYPGSFPKTVEINLIETPQQAVLRNLKERQKVNFGNGFFQALLLILMFVLPILFIYMPKKCLPLFWRCTAFPWAFTFLTAMATCTRSAGRPTSQYWPISWVSIWSTQVLFLNCFSSNNICP